jgi:hypothetical protein
VAGQLSVNVGQSNIQQDVTMNIAAIIAGLGTTAFPSTGTVQQQVGNALSDDESNYTYANVDGLGGLKCRIWAIRSTQGGQVFQTFPSASHTVLTP